MHPYVAPHNPHSLPQALLSCDWPGCTSTEVFQNITFRSHHVSAIHIRDVLRNTSGSCTWPGCTTVRLDTSKKLETHVTNIHVDPLRCTVRGCERTLPFGRKADLERHVASIHTRSATWKCPKKDCKRHIRGFPRKDKLSEHVRELNHGSFKCDYDHCRVRGKRDRRYLTEAQLLAHHETEHGNFECSLFSCKGTVSACNLRALDHHLVYGFRGFETPVEDLENYRFHRIHGFQPPVVDKIIERVANLSRDGKYTVTEDDLFHI